MVAYCGHAGIPECAGIDEGPSPVYKSEDSKIRYII